MGPGFGPDVAGCHPDGKVPRGVPFHDARGSRAWLDGPSSMVGWVECGHLVNAAVASGGSRAE